MAAAITLLDMTAENGGAADLDRRHDASLCSGQRGAMLLTIDFTVAAEDVRHFQPGTVHQPGAQTSCGAGGVGLLGPGQGSRSSGLAVEHTLLVAIRR